MANYCRYCGSPVREGAKFCKSCGKPLTKQPWEQAPGKQSRRRKAEAAAPERRSPQPPADSGQIPPQVVMAPSSAGEIDLGSFLASAMEETASAAETVSGPLAGILQGAGSVLGGFFRIFRKPSALLGVLVMAALWVVLAMLRGSDSQIVKVLSLITFSEGGFGRSLPGMAGGVLGRATVAAALLSLFTGGLKSAVKGIGALFTGHGEKRGILSILLGFLAGVALYFAFAGIRASAQTAMAGAAGALISLEALGSENGKLHALAQSLTSRKAGGVRTAEQGRCAGLLTGLSIGFAAGAALGASGFIGGL